MKLTIALEQRFYRTPDGRCWTESLYPRSFWSRYLAVFDELEILARVHGAAAALESWKPVDGEGVSVAAVPAYIGPWDFVRQSRQVRASITRALDGSSAMLLRVPGLIATMASAAMPKGHPFGIEVISDPYDLFSPGASTHPLRPFFRWWFSRTLKAQCRRAACSLYVTQQTLQRRYPPGTKHSRKPPGNSSAQLSVGVSDVELPDAAFVASAPSPCRRGRFRIAFVGMLEVRYKALDVLITALAQCLRAGLDAELAIIGSGRLVPAYKTFAKARGISDRVLFLGSLAAGGPVRHELDNSDLFVLPSRVEGLPRALVEAMARGLACVGTRVGGVPELLPEYAMVKPDKPDELAAKILQIASDAGLRARLGAQNLRAAWRYHQDVLQPKRIAFYRCLRDLTAAWQRQGANQPFPDAAGAVNHLSGVC